VSGRMQRVARLRALPWAVLLRAGALIGERWTSLSESERARIKRLVSGSRGRPGNLSSKERAELRKLIGKLDLGGVGRELVPMLRGRRGGRRGRR
jgi:hypothetical protein